MRILGIDPGLESTGWGIVSFDGKSSYQPVSYGVIKTSPKENLQKRVYTIAEDIGYLAKKYNAEVCSMEDIFFTKNISSAIPVAKVIGAILHKMAEMEIDTFLYSPREIKMAVTGLGGAEKIQVQTMVRQILKLKEIPKPDHAADALADCICYCSHFVFDNKIKL